MIKSVKDKNIGCVGYGQVSEHISVVVVQRFILLRGLTLDNFDFQWLTVFFFFITHTFLLKTALTRLVLFDNNVNSCFF